MTTYFDTFDRELKNVDAPRAGTIRVLINFDAPFREWWGNVRQMGGCVRPTPGVPAFLRVVDDAVRGEQPIEIDADLYDILTGLPGFWRPDHAKYTRKTALLPADQPEPHVQWERIQQLEERIVFDCSVASEFTDFPLDLRKRVNLAILEYGVCSLPLGVPQPDIDPREYQDRMSDLSHDLHTIFHELQQRNIEGFSDSPRNPVRALFARSEERRERRAQISRQQ